MAKTYSAIATTTLGSAQSSVTFSTIPGTYTDLVLVAQGKMVTGGAINNQIEFNADSGTNYSRTFLYGDGSSAASGRASNQNWLAYPYWDSTNPSITIVQIMNYSNTTTFKTSISRNAQPAGTTTVEVGLWRSTSAITSIKITRGGGNNMDTGSTFTLYGIKQFT